MSSSVLKTQNDYLPAAILAKKFSYTSDYITKLARDGKIAAMQEGRKWLINENSLRSFLSEVSKAKEQRSAALSTERKLERQKHLATQVAASAPELTPAWAISLSAAAQSLVIVLCGGVVGLMGFVVMQENLNITTLVSGARLAVSEVDNAVVAHSLPSLPTSNTDQLAALSFASVLDWLWPNTKVETQINQLATNNQNQVMNGLVMINENDMVSTSTISDIRKSFSDEVDVVFDGSDTGVIKPVFKNASDESYRFLMVPVNTSTQ